MSQSHDLLFTGQYIILALYFLSILLCDHKGQLPDLKQIMFKNTTGFLNSKKAFVHANHVQLYGKVASSVQPQRNLDHMRPAGVFVKISTQGQVLQAPRIIQIIFT